MSAFLFACSESSDEARRTQASSESLQPAPLQLVVGPTSIRNGDAQGAQDITISNDFYAIAIGVDSASPWGVAKGGILDVAVRHKDTLESDFVSLVDFMPNQWAAWPSEYQETKVITQSDARIVVRTRRDFHNLLLETDFEFSSDSNLIKLSTKMTNPGDTPVMDLTTGFIACPSGGHLFGMPGISEGDSRAISEAPAFAKWSASYDENWVMALHSNFSDHVAYTGRDRYLKHELQPQESKTFVAWLQLEANADLSKVVAVDAALNHRELGRIVGKVLDDQGQAMAESFVVVHQQGKLHSWAFSDDGSFDFALPSGDYEVFATARRHAPGDVVTVSLESDQLVELSLTNLRAPGRIEFSVFDQTTSAPLDAMISLTQGRRPIVGYFGKSRFFTELSLAGEVAVDIAPGEYQFEVSVGRGFFAKPHLFSATVSPGQTTKVAAPVAIIEKPSTRGWFNADLHHHSDVLDGFTNPEFVVRAQLSAGIDLPFLSDHDSTINNRQMQSLAASRGADFIAGTELSASWGHFNAYPINYELSPSSEIGSMSVQEIFHEARRLGADIIHVNHPFDNYGYFDSLAQETELAKPKGSIVPGGYDLGFDLIEITTDHEPKTLERAWQLWNAGKPAYFAAGSDVHDVWNTPAQYISGAARSFVYLDTNSAPTTAQFVSALKAGHSYASQGPIVYPEHLFGADLLVPATKELGLRYELQSVVGLQTVQLIERGEVIEQIDFSISPEKIEHRNIEFTVIPKQDTWYSLVVSDVADKYAYTNPLWVKVERNP